MTIFITPELIQNICGIDFDYSGTIVDFLDLDEKKLSIRHKLWVAERLFSQRKILELDYEICKSLLPIFEKAFPDDKCIQNLLDGKFEFLHNNGVITRKMVDDVLYSRKNCESLIRAERMTTWHPASAASFVIDACLVQISHDFKWLECDLTCLEKTPLMQLYAYYHTALHAYCPEAYCYPAYDSVPEDFLHIVKQVYVGK